MITPEELDAKLAAAEERANRKAEKDVAALKSRLQNREALPNHADRHRAGGGDALPASGSITVKDIDGVPTATGVDTLRFSNGSVTDDGAGQVTIAISAAGAAPDSVNYLVGTANATLSAEIVVGTTPGGELGGTWASPTVDAVHSGSPHQAIHDEVAASLTARADLHFQGRGIAAVDNAGSTRTEIISGAYFDAIVDSADTNAAGKGNVYSTIQAAITAGRVSIFVRSAADTADITVVAGDAVTYIIGESSASTRCPVNLRVEKADVVIEKLQFYNGTIAKKLVLAGARCTAFGCVFLGALTPGSALINNVAGITSTATSIAFDNGIDGGMAPRNGAASRGYMLVGDEIIGYTGGGAAVSGTITTTAAGRGRAETLAQAAADNAPIYSLANGHLEVDAADCQIIQNRFLSCSDARTSCVLLFSSAVRARVTSNVFLNNTTYSCLLLYPDSQVANGPQAVQIVANVFDSNTPYSWIIEAWYPESSNSTNDVHNVGIAGNLVRQFDGGALYIYGRNWNISGNTFDGIAKNTVATLVNSVGGYLSTDTAITFDTTTGTGNQPSGKGLIYVTRTGEYILYSSRSATQYLGCRRGAYGTTAAALVDNDPIQNRSQRGIQQNGGNIALGTATFILASGNTLTQLRVLGMAGTTYTATPNPMVWSTNTVTICDVVDFTRQTSWLENAAPGGMIIDVRTGDGVSIIGGRGGLPTNLGTDTFLLGSPSGGAVSGAAAVIPAGNFIALGRVAGDGTVITKPMINATGATSVIGDVVLISTTVDNEFVLAGGAASTRVAGIVISAVANGATAQIAIIGTVDILCTTAAVVRGDLLQTSATAAQAATAAAVAGAVIGRAVAAKGAGSPGLVKCTLSLG